MRNEEEARSDDGEAQVEVHTVGSTLSTLMVNASVQGAGLAIGFAAFEIQQDGCVICEHMHVEHAYRRRGVATKLHAAAEVYFGMPVQASAELTPDSVAFYMARNAAIPQGVVVRSYGEWFGGVDESNIDEVGASNACSQRDSPCDHPSSFEM